MEYKAYVEFRVILWDGALSSEGKRELRGTQILDGAWSTGLQVRLSFASPERKQNGFLYLQQFIELNDLLCCAVIVSDSLKCRDSTTCFACGNDFDRARLVFHPPPFPGPVSVTLLSVLLLLLSNYPGRSDTLSISLKS
jgi:hypothetical protein